MRNPVQSPLQRHAVGFLVSVLALLAVSNFPVRAEDQGPSVQGLQTEPNDKNRRESFFFRPTRAQLPAGWDK